MGMWVKRWISRVHADRSTGISLAMGSSSAARRHENERERGVPMSFAVRAATFVIAIASVFAAGCHGPQVKYMPDEALDLTPCDQGKVEVLLDRKPEAPFMETGA